MRSPSVLGISVGLFALLLGVVGTLRRGDPHFVSATPDLVSTGLIALAMIAAMRALRPLGPSLVYAAARRLTVVACVVEAAGIAAFTVWYLPPHPLSLGVFAAAASAALIAVIGWSAARLALAPAVTPSAPAA